VKRIVRISPRLQQQFIELVRLDSESDPPKETGGHLGGFEINNEIIIDTLIIPNQRGFPDRFEEIDGYGNCVGDHGRIPVGYIHTHPGNYASFLSSIDLHMQNLFQSQIPESIAIVHSVKYETTPAFSLTNLGIGIISSCRVNNFHLHEDSNLYEVAQHVIYDESIPVIIDDQRVFITEDILETTLQSIIQDDSANMAHDDDNKNTGDYIGTQKLPQYRKENKKTIYRESYSLSETSLSESSIVYDDDSDMVCNKSLTEAIENINKKNREKFSLINTNSSVNGIHFTKIERGKGKLTLIKKSVKRKKGQQKTTSFMDEDSDDESKSKRKPGY
jgi:hypothetical protein